MWLKVEGGKGSVYAWLTDCFLVQVSILPLVLPNQTPDTRLCPSFVHIHLRKFRRASSQYLAVSDLLELSLDSCPKSPVSAEVANSKYHRSHLASHILGRGSSCSVLENSAQNENLLDTVMGG